MQGKSDEENKQSNKIRRRRRRKQMIGSQRIKQKEEIIIVISFYFMIKLPTQKIILLRPKSANISRHDLPIFHFQPNISVAESRSESIHKQIVPVKQYSNKFLRTAKIKQDKIIHDNMNKITPPFAYSRKDPLTNKVKKARQFHYKQQITKTLKTEPSENNDYIDSQRKQRSSYKQTSPAQTPFQYLNNSTIQDRISHSRALELFSKVFKNQTIDRMKVRKQVIRKDLDVTIKQMKLQGKQNPNKYKDKPQLLGIVRKKGLTSKTKKPKALPKQHDDFQIAGW